MSFICLPKLLLFYLKGRKFRGILISRMTETTSPLISRVIDFRKFCGNLNSRFTNYVCSFIVDNYQNTRYNSSNRQLFYLFYLITSKKVKQYCKSPIANFFAIHKSCKILREFNFADRRFYEISRKLNFADFGKKPRKPRKFLPLRYFKKSFFVTSYRSVCLI